MGKRKNGKGKGVFPFFISDSKRTREERVFPLSISLPLS